MRTLYAFACLALAGLLPSAVHAQAFGAVHQDARAVVRAPAVDAMGGAAAAFARTETTFFYNPAHFARGSRRVVVSVGGVSAGLSSDVFEGYRLWDDQVRPAVNEGLDEIRANDPDRLDALYDDIYALGRRQSVASATAYGPALYVPIPAGPTRAAVGAGAFYTADARLRFADAGAGLPLLDLYGQTTLVVPFTAAAAIPNTPVAVGLTTRYALRHVSAKAAPLDALSPTDEQLYILSGSTVALDLGLHAADVAPGLDLGLAVYDALGGDITYAYDDQRIDLVGSGEAEDAAEVAALEARFNARDVSPSVRVGAAYRVPLPDHNGLLVSGVTLAADYVSASSSSYDQPFGAHLRSGVEVAFGRYLRALGGFSQGYLSGGVDVSFAGIGLSYVVYGVEDGRVPGQLGRYSQRLQLRIGGF